MTSKTVLGVFFILMFGFVLVAAVHESWRRIRLRGRGVRATARIVRFERSEDTDGTPRYSPVVSFTLPDGSEISAESPTGTPHTETGSVGDLVEIVYDRHRPQHVYLPALDPGYGGYGSILTMGILAVLAIAALVTLTRELIP
ncbi:DUF3592 domain-containing protein [Streptomyces vilmorinianum]|uniref:DUF3592 domain-containing protein n=1 Tax=Streptomyces vilmorinianum TaxID=3051092 RepID=UPI0010FB62C5|nr:DUF3592 domain-containing protein [Streptomyces vilmorinianum]